MPMDKELVLKNFGEASETEFRFHYVIQLFLSLEEEKTHDPYHISREHVYTLMSTPARLPTGIKTFILWQRNIMKRDSEEILNMQMPRGLKHKYDVKESRLTCEIEQQNRINVIKACIDELETYMHKLHEVRAILEATEERFRSVEDYLLRAQSIDSAITPAISEQKQQLEDYRITITNLNADLEDDTLPDLIKFEHTPKAAHELMLGLSNTYLKIHDEIRKHKLAQDNL